MRGNADRYQRVSAGIVMIEASCKSFAFVDRQIELELVTGARRRIRPDGVAAVVEVELVVRSRQDAYGAVEKPRKLRERDRSLVIKSAGRMTFTQELCDRRNCLGMRGRELVQIDFLSGPAGPHGRQWRYDASMRINSAQRVGVPAFRAARVEQKIVKVPKNEVVVALGRSKASFAGNVGLENDLAIHQQSEKRDPRKTVLPTQLFNLLRRRQHGQGGRKLRIADFEQRAGARRFQDYLVIAPSHVCEPRQDKSIRIAELRRSRPIIGNLRFDDDHVLADARAPEGVLQ